MCNLFCCIKSNDNTVKQKNEENSSSTLNELNENIYQILNKLKKMENNQISDENTDQGFITKCNTKVYF